MHHHPKHCSYTRIEGAGGGVEHNKLAEISAVPARCRNFTDQGARDYWLNTVIEEVCHEHASHTGFTTVYFDEVDDNWCGYWGNATHGGCWFDNATQIKQAEASYSLYRLMVQKLNDCGIVPIMATFSMMERSIDHGIDPTNPCKM